MDTSSGNQLLQDEEILALIDSEGNKYAAAAVAAETVGAWFARKADKTVGKLSISQGRVSDMYFKLADRLHSELTQRSAGPYAGGISQDDMDLDIDDTDRVDPVFTMKQFEYANEPQTTSE